MQSSSGSTSEEFFAIDIWMKSGRLNVAFCMFSFHFVWCFASLMNYACLLERFVDGKLKKNVEFRTGDWESRLMHAII